MTHRIARRAAFAAASVAVAVAGLLTMGGAASAATLPSSEHSGVVKVAEGHDEDARLAWVLDQIEWAQHHGLMA
ncbi:hypothetical protein [Streptomyces carpinensis]|uniref:Uncharacterized protein n=1 Tax=Streptomyces carpinensis TaxID=66369 RepID=A0ABV1W5S3_9ACTN|nr:hypothetical protein [Streptomyces carpinensis]